ncbi:MAG: TasA family protein [bacterium]|nr:TasA family protein [bacterium]
MNIFGSNWVNLLLVIGSLSAGIVGSYAYFTATQSNQNNFFSAGTLDLSVTGDNNQVNEPISIENLGASPEIQGLKTWEIENTGSLSGRLMIEANNVKNKENGCNDQEINAEPRCDADTVGELGSVVNMTVLLNDTFIMNSTLGADEEYDLGEKWEALDPVIMEPNETLNLTMKWDVDPETYGNEIQSDSLSFDIKFQLTQYTDNSDN